MRKCVLTNHIQLFDLNCGDMIKIKIKFKNIRLAQSTDSISMCYFLGQISVNYLLRVYLTLFHILLLSIHHLGIILPLLKMSKQIRQFA